MWFRCRARNGPPELEARHVSEGTLVWFRCRARNGPPELEARHVSEGTLVWFRCRARNGPPEPHSQTARSAERQTSAPATLFAVRTARATQTENLPGEGLPRHSVAGPPAAGPGSLIVGIGGVWHPELPLAAGTAHHGANLAAGDGDSLQTEVTTEPNCHRRAQCQFPGERWA